MWFLSLGVVLVLLKYLEIGPVAAWSWWMVLLPFGLAAAWWAWADAAGYTRRRAVEGENARKQPRVDNSKEKRGALNRRK